MKQTINPHNKLYKNPKSGILAGVCAGVGDYLDLSHGLVRLFVIIAFLFTSGLVLGAYIVMAIILTRKPDHLFQTGDEEEFWKGVAHSPRFTFSELKYKFMTLNERLKKMEDRVTSREFELEEKYRNL